ncbi:hypothetical protein [Vitreoscilla filiformis]|nr:hypothetical protein [Vitreoscilla filiformis]
MNKTFAHDGKKSAAPTLVILAWLLGVWWLSDQYVALAMNSDGLFYTGDALYRQNPSAFSKDLFFLAQTQGDFSLFGGLYGHLISVLDIKPAGWLISTLGRLLWGSGAVALAHALWRQSSSNGWWACLALMLLLPSNYDSQTMFFYGAADVTPRTWAEAWVLWCLAFRVRERWLWSVVALGLGLAFHPLMALPGLGLWVLLLPRYQWVWGTVGVLVVGLMGATFKVGPLAYLFQAFDPLWWECAVVLAGQIVSASWGPVVLVKAGGIALLLLAVARWHPQPLMRRWAGALAGVQLLMLGLWWLAEETRSVLLLQLQLWRVLWLCQLLAPALWWSSLPPWREWTVLHGIQVSLVMAAVLSNSLSTVWLFLPGVFFSWPRVVHYLQKSGLKKALLAGSVILLAMSLSVRFPEFMARALIYELDGHPHGFWMGVASEALWTLPLFCVVAVLVGATQLRVWRWVFAGGLLLPVWAVLLGVLGGQAKQIFQPLPSTEALRAVIPSDSLIYWDADVGGSWNFLRQGHYISAYQGAAALFSREVAMEFRRRLAHVAQVGLLGADVSQDEVKKLPLQASGYTIPRDIGTRSPFARLRVQLGSPQALSSDAAQTLCRDPILDYVLISRDLPEATWRVPYEGVPSGVVSVFKCVR